MLSASARAAIVKILGNDDLASIASWADNIKPGKDLSSTPEGQAITKEFPKNDTWHYINMPIGVTKRSEVLQFRKQDDVVGAIRLMISTLEKHEKPNTALTHAVALKWLVHLVADIHNPMHGATLFYKADKDGKLSIVTDPAKVQDAYHGEGGNEIRLGDWKLHAYWDAPMVDVVLPGAGAPGLTSFLAKQCPTSTIGAIDPDSRPELDWAVESAKAARQTYVGIVARGMFLDGQRVKVTAEMASNYSQIHRDLSEKQMVSAAKHLAGLLNGIKWAK